MNRAIGVSRVARQQIALFPGPMREELIAHIAELADNPVEWLRRASDSAWYGYMESSYRSIESPELRVTLHFDGFFKDPPRLELVFVTIVSDDP